MYSSKQEHIVFDVLLLMVIAFQVSSLSALKNGHYAPLDTEFIVLLLVNLLLFIGMILYARWVWKTLKLIQAFWKVVVHECMLIAIIAFFYIIWSRG